MVLEIDKKSNKIEKKNLTNNGYKQRRIELLTFIQKKTSNLKYKLKTFYLAVSYIDTILLTQNNFNVDFELVALVCLLIAGKVNYYYLVKFDEEDAIIPDFCDFGFINYKKFYTEEEIRRYEVMCLLLLDYNVKISTQYNFLYNLCLNGILFSDECAFDEVKNLKVIQPLPVKFNEEMTNLEKLYKLSFDILEIVVFNKIDSLDASYTNYSPFKIACAIIALVRDLYGFKNWNERLKNIYKIDFDTDLINSFKFIKR